MARIPHIAYTDDSGRARELVVCTGAFGSLLVVDSDAATLSDRRLVAHIPADEPPGNAALVCQLYMKDRARCPCRPLVPEDFQCAPLPMPAEHDQAVGGHERGCEQIAHEGQLYRIRPHLGQGVEPLELRWSRRAAARPTGPWAPTTLREVLTALESYEPICTMTARALAGHNRAISVDALRHELTRVQESSFVLNRGLREAVLDAVERRGVVSMSELALRCGMVKRDRRGLPVGDTTWLARRVGLMPEGGKLKPTRWVHSDVLALIARQGLGVGPREVELS